MIAGILYGLGAAVCQSLSYIASGHFVRKFHSSTLVLLTLSHIVMGCFSIIVLAASWPDRFPPCAEFTPSLIGGVVFYLIGQTGLFLALRHTDASRVSPLLGMKLVILASISVAFLGKHYGIGQWGAVAIAVAAAAMLNESGGRIPVRSLLWVLLTCTGYSFSDLNITALVGHFKYLGLVRGCLVAASMSYILSGIFGVILLAFIPRPSRTMWRNAVPFAAAWLGGMLLLFACFGAIGVVFGNIVQSTRGIISIVFGALIAKAGYHHLETHLPRNVLLKRVAAATLMAAAIALFSLSS